MNQKLKWSLLAGFVLSLCLHIASAVITALYPYHDEPLTPNLVFVYLLLPGWAIAGRSYHVHLWNETIAVAINGAFYGMVILCLMTVWNSLRDKSKRGL
jgi:fumarate reductase subunit D